MSKISRSDLGMIAESGPDTHAVLISRDVWKSPVFRNGLEASLFVWMMTAAAPVPGTVTTQWGDVPLKTGEVLTSERELSKEFEMHPDAVRNLFGRMVQAGLVGRSQHQPNQQAGTVWAVNMSKFSLGAPQS